MFPTRSKRIGGTGPKVAGVGALPADATPYLGRMWLGPDGKVYKARYVANLAGSDTILYNIPINADGLTGDFDVSFKLYTDGIPSTDSDIFRSGLGNSLLVTSMTLASGNPAVRFYSSTWSPLFTGYCGNNSGKWSMLKIAKIGDTAAVFLNGASVGSWNVSAWSPASHTSHSFRGQAASGSMTKKRICDYTLKRGSSLIISSPMDDGSGTVVRDISGNGNNATITDGSPTGIWVADWVPTSI